MIDNLILVQTLSSGGAERAAANVANEIDGDTNVVLYEDKVDYPCDKETVILGSGPGRSYVSKFWKFIYRVWKFRKIKSNKKPRNSISFSDGPNLVNILSARKNENVVVTVQNRRSNLEGEDSFLQVIYRFLYSFFYPKADIVICASRGVKKDMVDNFNVPEEKVKVIYNSVDLDLVEQESETSLDDEEEDIFNHPSIINVGRLTKQKGQWHLIRSFKHLKKDINDAKLIMLGEGELQNYLVNLAKDLDLDVYSAWGNRDCDVLEDHDVFFLGFVDNPFKYLVSSDIFAFPSLWEGFSLVAIEAAACGLPIVSSDCDFGARELLAPSTDIDDKVKQPDFAEYGVLIPVGSHEEYGVNHSLTDIEFYWKDVLSQLLKDNKQRKRYGSLAKTRAKDFSIESIINDWNEVLSK